MRVSARINPRVRQPLPPGIVATSANSIPREASAIDETPLPDEAPEALVCRLAEAKAQQGELNMVEWLHVDIASL